MKALVLSGGAGTRLRPFSHSMPKQLIPIANKPVLAHVVDNLLALGITEIGVIVGERGHEIRAALGDGSSSGAAITFIQQDEPRGLAHCVALARDFLGDDEFVMYLGDNMLPGGITGVAGEFAALRPAAQVVVHKVDDPRAFGVAEVDAEGRVTALAEKPREPRSDLALIGVYFFTAAVHEAIAAVRPSARGELEITDAIQWLVENGRDVRAHVHSGYWKDTGKVEDVLECNRELLDGILPLADGTVDAESEVIGPVVVEAGARIVRSRIVGPAVIGAGALVEDSHIEPHTSLGAGCVVSRAEVGYSIALAGATVRQVRIRGSLIGRSAAVSLAAERVHRLVVGDHTRVEVAAG